MSQPVSSPAADIFRPDARNEVRKGMTFGISAYLCWGLLPVFFKLLPGIDAGEIVSQRILWSMLLMLGVVMVTGARTELARILASGRMLAVLSTSAMLIAINWTTYIFAVGHGHILAASLGYFMSPLLNVLLGRIVFREHMSRRQWTAIGIASLGVALLGAGAIDTLWISLLVAASWGGYSTIRKLTPVGAAAGLTIETMVLTPLAVAYLVWLNSHGGIAFGNAPSTSVLLALSGLMTTIPLLLFTGAARRMPLSVLGLLQYLAPTIQFFLSIFAYAEPLKMTQLGCFMLIWGALALFSYDMVRRNHIA